MRHLAVIMDGNGRWAQRQGKPREFGHQQGADNLRRLCVLCRERDIRYVTVYAFSTENWRRPRLEVAALMRIFPQFFRKYAKEMKKEGIRLRFIGEQDGLSDEVIRTMREAEETSQDRENLDLIIAFNYGGRRELAVAAQQMARDALLGKISPEDITEELVGRYLYLPDVPDPDLLIRTGGDFRTSNFLIWQTAYTELYIEDCLWPDFGAEELDEAIAAFHSRQRRFGGIGSE